MIRRLAVVAALTIGVAGLALVALALRDTDRPPPQHETKPYPMVAAAAPTVPSDRVQLYLLALRNPLAGPELVDRPGDAVIAMHECVGFGTLYITGEHATVEVESMCDGLCGRGALLGFVRHDGVWRVDRHAGRSGWLS